MQVGHKNHKKYLKIKNKIRKKQKKTEKNRKKQKKIEKKPKYFFTNEMKNK